MGILDRIRHPLFDLPFQLFRQTIHLRQTRGGVPIKQGRRAIMLTVKFELGDLFVDAIQIALCFGKAVEARGKLGLGLFHFPDQFIELFGEIRAVVGQFIQTVRPKRDNID